MALIGMWLRLELRRRWRSLLVLTLLVAISSGTVLAAVAGARRGDTSVDRLAAETLPATAAVLPNEPGFDWDVVRAMPGVVAVGEFPVTAYRVGDIPPEAYPDGFPSDRTTMDALERPVVLEGRPADPDRADEAVVTAAFVESYGLGPGDVVDLRLYSPEQIDGYYQDPVVPEPVGAVVPTTIVGVVRSLWFSDDPGSPGQLQPSAGLLETYRAELLGATESVFVNALVRLADGPAGMARFRADLAAVTGRDDIEMLDVGAETERLRRTTTFESGSLLAFGLAALAAAVVLVGQAVARYVAGAVADLQVLRAVGLDRRTAVGAAAAAPALAGLAGAAVGAGLALVASPLFPLGTAAAFEPAPGPAADPIVLGVGGPLLAVLVGVGAAGAARIGLAGRPDRSARPSATAALAARAGLGVPLVVGIRFALEPGRGRSALPVRPALFGAVTGVLGVLAAFTFSAGVADAAANPARFGQTQQLDLFSGENGVEYGPPAADLLAPMTADPDVVGALDARMGVLDVAASPVTVFSHSPVGPAGFPTVLREGRMARTDGEIVLAPRTADELGAAVGDRLPATGSAGSGDVTVVGIGFVPYAGHNNYDDGGWLSSAGYDRFVAGFKFHFGYVALRPGADVEAALPRLAGLAAPLVGGDPSAVPMRMTEPLVEAAQIRNVEVLPLVLGGFLALLAVGAVGHTLATAVRRRRHVVAVLRALGMTRGQARGMVVTQASVLAVVGLLFGVPLGVAVGRVLWRFVADITPLQYEAPLALLALLLAVPVALLVANALAAWPGRQAARLRIAHVLRAE
ncbi:FtsX-like permease family protein [Pseudonocardia saturnea]